jgi:AcrR family transcriptional regulator
MPRAGLTPDVVVAHEGDLADAEGYDRLNLAALAAVLGVRVPSLYKHVAGLGDVQHRLALAGLRDLDRVLRDAAVGRSGAEALRSVGHAYRRYAATHPGRYAAALRAPDRDDDEAGAVTQELTDRMVEVMRGYGLEEDAALHAVRTVRAALHGFASLEQAGGFGLPYDLDASFSELLETLDRGLSGLSRRPAAPR